MTEYKPRSSSETSPGRHPRPLPLPYAEEMPDQLLRLYATEAAAKKAGLLLSSFDGERLSTTLYALLPAGEKKPAYLLSSTYRLTVAERRWAEERTATVTKLGRFPAGGSFMPLQQNMVRRRAQEEGGRDGA